MASGSSPSRQTFRFGDVELDERSGELRRHGSKVRLSEQPFQILRLLLAHAGEVVTREELRQALWPDSTFVDFEAGLNSAVRRLRDALNDSADSPKFVETVPRRGYRLIAPVESPLPRPPPPALASDVPPEPPPIEPAPQRPRRRALPTVIVIVLAAGIATGTFAWRRNGVTPATPPRITALVVLPFENLTGDASEGYFVDGITDAVTTNLAQIHALRVISRTSARHYHDTKKPLPEIARELGVNGVVEGTVMRSGGRVRVSAQLIHAGTDHHFWSRSYERDMRDVLALQNEVASAIARAIHVEIRPEEQRRLAGGRSIQPEAYEAYLKGRFFWSKRTRADMLKAIAYFEEAIARDPTYAPAYSGLSDAHRLSDQAGLASPRESMPKAEAAARKALALDDTLAEAHASLAGVLYRYHWDWAGAEKEFRLSLELDPNSAEAHRAYGAYLSTARRHPESLAEARRALQLNPLSPVIAAQLGRVLMRLGRNEEAREQFRKAREIDPRFGTQGQEAMLHLRAGDPARAIEAFEEGAATSGRPNRWLGYAYAISGRRAEALAMLAELDRLAATEYVPPLSRVVIHIGLGDRDRALTLLEEAYESRDIEVPDIGGEVHDLLKDEPRFRAVLQGMGLPAPESTPAGM